MSRARLRIVDAGPMTSVQDGGRPGWRRFGVPPSGPVDRRAFAAGMAACGGSTSGIEVAPGGLTFVCEEGAVAMAVTGAARATVNGVDLGGWSRFTLTEGATCVVRVEQACWGYVAFAGTLEAASWLGSQSTHLIAGLGGGRLGAGDVVEIAEARENLAFAMLPAAPERPVRGLFRAVLGPQQDHFGQEALALLTSASFVAMSRFDRMGRGLDGPALQPLRIDMPSGPAVRGALQVDGEGRVSLLTADHQTTGGYPRIAVVIEPDIDALAQLPAGEAVRFELVSAAEAIAATRAAASRDQAWLKEIAAGVRERAPLMLANLVDGMAVRQGTSR